MKSKTSFRVFFLKQHRKNSLKNIFSRQKVYFWISAFDHRAIVLDKMHIVQCSICASSRTRIGANPRRQMHCQPNQVVLGSSKTSRDIERPTSNCSERKKTFEAVDISFYRTISPCPRSLPVIQRIL